MAQRVADLVNLDILVGRIRSSLKEWDRSPTGRNEWFHYSPEYKIPGMAGKFRASINLYLRKSFRLLPPERITDDWKPGLSKLEPCLDLGNIDLSPRGEGLLTRILVLLEVENPWNFLYVESVLEPRLEKFLENNGFQKKDVFHKRYEHSPPSYWKGLDPSRPKPERSFAELNAEVKSHPGYRHLERGKWS